MSQFDESKIRRDGSGQFAEKPSAPEADGVDLGAGHKMTDLDAELVHQHSSHATMCREAYEELEGRMKRERERAFHSDVTVMALRDFPQHRYAEISYGTNLDNQLTGSISRVTNDPGDWDADVDPDDIDEDTLPSIRVDNGDFPMSEYRVPGHRGFIDLDAVREAARRPSPPAGPVTPSW